MHKKHVSTIVRASQIKELVARHYEPGRQDRCKLWVYRHIVYPKYGISERTFFRMLDEKTEEDKRQLCIDF